MMDYEVTLLPFIIILLVGVLGLGGAVLALLAWWSQRFTDKQRNEPRAIKERRERGECVVCGYDLKANVSGRFPECGTRAWQ